MSTVAWTSSTASLAKTFDKYNEKTCVIHYLARPYIILGRICGTVYLSRNVFISRFMFVYLILTVILMVLYEVKIASDFINTPNKTPSRRVALIVVERVDMKNFTLI